MYPYPQFSSGVTHAFGIYFSCCSILLDALFPMASAAIEARCVKQNIEGTDTQNEVQYNLGKVTSHFSHDVLLAEFSFPHVE